jgi:hypothetical protein
MSDVKSRLAALERYQRSLAPSGVALVILEENDTWAAQYGKNRSSFPTQVTALHFVHQHAPQNTPTIIIDL